MSNIKKLQNLAEQTERHNEIDLAIKIKLKRKELQLTQKELADKMGVKQNVISRIESLEGGISTITLAKFCKATGVELQFINLNNSFNIFELSNHIIQKCNQELGENYDVTNLKLNKLIFFIEIELFKVYNKRIFEYPIQAWPHGPVYPDIYNKYKLFGYNPIIESKSSNLNSESLIKEIDNAINKYIGFSAKELEELSHKDKKWIVAFKKGRNSAIIF
jgi:uncharacterized phage-associated protein/DNA-binding XRE family transcriptional regulator